MGLIMSMGVMEGSLESMDCGILGNTPMIMDMERMIRSVGRTPIEPGCLFGMRFGLCLGTRGSDCWMGLGGAVVRM